MGKMFTLRSLSALQSFQTVLSAEQKGEQEKTVSSHSRAQIIPKKSAALSETRHLVTVSAFSCHDCGGIRFVPSLTAPLAPSQIPRWRIRTQQRPTKPCFEGLTFVPCFSISTPWHWQLGSAAGSWQYGQTPSTACLSTATAGLSAVLMTLPQTFWKCH